MVPQQFVDRIIKRKPAVRLQRCPARASGSDLTDAAKKTQRSAAALESPLILG